MKPRLLVACEKSGRVREAFRKKGWDAYSCDIMPAEDSGPHLQCDVREILNDGWSMLIAHPPCTYLSNAGAAWWDRPGRARERLNALEFFLDLWEADIPQICIENPLGCADRVVTKHHQIIQPYYFGDPHLKTTCLWLKNLPLLHFQLEDGLFSARSGVDRPEPIYVDQSGKARYWTDAKAGTSRTGKESRSRTFQGIADAMAEQWGRIPVVA